MATSVGEKRASERAAAAPVRLTAEGDLVLGGLEQLRRRLEDVLFEKRRCVVLDLHFARYISARALGILAACASEAERQGLELGLCNLHPWHRRLLEAAGLTSLVREGKG